MKSTAGKENIYNVPNLISAYRLVMFPVIIGCIIQHNESLFTILLCINLVSDVLDGFIARHWHLETAFGASLDNLADFGMYISAVAGMAVFKWSEMAPDVWILYVFLSLLIITIIVSLIKFRKMPGLHLYSSVAAGYLQGFFFFILFSVGYFPWLFFLSVGWGIVAYIEKTIILIRINEIKKNIRGLYWLIKEEKK